MHLLTIRFVKYSSISTSFSSKSKKKVNPFLFLDHIIHVHKINFFKTSPLKAAQWNVSDVCIVTLASPGIFFFFFHYFLLLLCKCYSGIVRFLHAHIWYSTIKNIHNYICIDIYMHIYSRSESFKVSQIKWKKSKGLIFFPSR